jgi:D,D-heptose 1,7-bisphosphate phosphatase
VVTVRQAAVLVGGLGTRLGALTAATPKPLLACGDRPFLAWVLRELCRFGVEETLLLTGYLAEEVERALPGIAAGLPAPMRLVCCPEQGRAGTGGALYQARDRLAERFLLCNGDSWLDFNLARLLADAAQDEAEVVGHMVLRHLPDATRAGVAELEGDRVTAFRERPAPGQPGMANAGIYLLRRSVLDHVAPECSLERAVLPRLAEAGALRATVGGGYFIDIGIPADLERAQTELPARLHRRALFLDRDGVINLDHGWVGQQERFEFVPGAIATMRAAADAGWHVFVVTNQSGIARGFYDEADFAALSAWMTDRIRAEGGNVDGLRYCPTHPEAALEAYRRVDPRRKPGAGMLLELIAAWELDPARCLLIGDQANDLQAAAACGVPAKLFPGGDLSEFAGPLLAG